MMIDRPQDPTLDGQGWTFETLEHGGSGPDSMPQAIRGTDPQGRSAIYLWEGRVRTHATRLLLELVQDCRAAVTDCLKPDGISAEEAIDELLLLLDGPRWREAEAAIERGEQPPPTA